VLVKVNTDVDTTIRADRKIAGLPTVLVCNPGGEEIDRTLGFIEAKEFIKTVENYRQGIGTLAAMQELERTPGRTLDAEFLYELGQKYFNHSEFKEADIRFESAGVLDATNEAGVADDSYYQRILIARKLEKWDHGIGHAQMLIEMWPKSEWADDAAIYIGFLHARAGNTRQAIIGYKNYLERWPKGEDADYAKKQIEALEAESETSGG